MTTPAAPGGPSVAPAYATALTDWLACAVGGSRERAARAARSGGRVAAAAAAGHVLDFDDTYVPGLAHLSAAVAPAALVVAAERGASAGEALRAYAEGFEAMAAIARASHPALYERGLHPTAVCGTAGAAVAAARLLDLPDAARSSAIALALLRAGGLIAAFGSDGKALQVGLAAEAGVEAARIAAAGARVPLARAAAGFEAALGGRFAEPDGASPAVSSNWIKAWPCCLQTHGAIECALRLREAGTGAAAGLAVRVHPLSRRAASVDVPVDGLEAKFSIPYVTALALTRGVVEVRDFTTIDPEVSALCEHVRVVEDPALGQSEAVVEAGGLAEGVEAALGSPARPLPSERLEEKVSSLAGPRLRGVLDDLARPAAEVLAAAGL